MCFESISDNVKADRKRQDQKFPIIIEEVWRCATPRNHLYITSGKGLGGWGQKKQFLLTFSTIHTDVEWVGQKNVLT